MSTITPEEMARCTERTRERRECAEKQAAQDAMDTPEEHFNMMPPEDELEWLRGQYVELKGMLDAARAGYSAAGQEAAALRRALASRAPTLRERAAVAFGSALTSPWSQMSKTSEDQAVKAAVRMADALVKELANG